MNAPLTLPRPTLSRATWRAIFALGATQIIGWGTSYYLLTVLGSAMRAELSLSAEVTYAGVSLTLVLSGLFGPRAGALIDRIGARLPMAAGSALMAAGLFALSLAQGPASYLLAWTIIGLATPLSLYQAAFTALTQVAGAGARRAITYLTFMGGLASTILWPISGALLPAVGWRDTCLIYAIVNLALCGALHLAALPTLTTRTADAPAPALPVQPHLPQGAFRPAMITFAIMLALNGFVFNGMSIHILDLLRARGYGASEALLVGTFVGIAQVLGRMGEMALGDRYHPLMTGLVSALLLPVSFAILGLGPAMVATGALYALVYGISNGLLTIARGTVTLHLFGASGYGARLGRLTIGQSYLGAAAPILFAWAIDAGGPAAGLTLAGVASMTALAALVGLLALARRHGAF